MEPLKLFWHCLRIVTKRWDDGLKCGFSEKRKSRAICATSNVTQLNIQYTPATSKCYVSFMCWINKIQFIHGHSIHPFQIKFHRDGNKDEHERRLIRGYCRGLRGHWEGPERSSRGDQSWIERKKHTEEQKIVKNVPAMTMIRRETINARNNKRWKRFSH